MHEIEKDMLKRLYEDATKLDVSSPSGGSTFNASDTGVGARKIYFNRTREPFSDPETYQGMLTFDVGNRFHDMIEETYKKAGWWLASEHRLYDPIMNLVGRIDILISEDGDTVPVEVKSASTYAYKKYIKAPGEGHIGQLTIYMKNIGAKHGYLHYIHKNNMEQTIWRIEYDEAVYERWLEIFTQVQSAIDTRTIPMPCEGCKGKNGFPAWWGWGGCRWRSRCWD